MCSIAHFFGKYIRRVDFARDMLDGERFVLNPFTNRILTKFDVTGSFGGHIMRPLDASIIVVVEKSRLGSVRKTMARRAHTGAEVAKVNDLFRSHNELRAVRSWRLPSHPRGPLVRKTMPPLILGNLKSGRRVPSEMAPPI